MKQSKKTAGIIQILSVMILALTVLYTVSGTGILSNLGSENVYWERARYLIGQGGATNYNGSSLCSFGYSLLLAPICLLIRSPYAAYKAAILLNGVFLCASYVLAVRTAKRLFPKEKEVFLSAGSLLALLCPVLATAKSFTGPEMAVLFFVWFAVYLLLGLREHYEKRDLILLAADLILMVFFQIETFGLVVGIVLVLAWFVKQRRLDETPFLAFLLALLLGVCAGNVIERVALYQFSKELDVTVRSSMELWFDGVLAGWKNGYLTGLLKALSGKLYALMISTLLLICPAFWTAARSLFAKIRKKEQRTETSLSVVFVLSAVQLMFAALYDNTRGAAMGLTSLTGLEAVGALLLLIGLVELKRSSDVWKDLMGYLLLFCICTLVTANLYQTQQIDWISGTNNGFLMLFQNWGMKPVAITYTAACLVILAAILLIVCLKESVRWKKLTGLLRVAGSIGVLSLYIGLSTLVFRHTAMKNNISYTRHAAPVASVLSEAMTEDTQICYLRGMGNDSETAEVLQSLLPEKKIQMIENDRVEQERFYKALQEPDVPETILLTGTGEKVTEQILPEKLPDYRPLYLTKSFAVWASRESESYDRINSAVSGRLEELTLSKIEEEQEELPVTDEQLAEQESSEAISEDGTEAADDLLSEKEAMTEEASEADSEEESEQLSEKESGRESETAGERESETMAETESERLTKRRTKTYAGKNVLASGTYRMELHFQKKAGSEGEDLAGRIKLIDSEGTILTRKVDESIFGESEQGAVVVEFSRQELIRDLEVEVSGAFASHAKAEHIYYWKTSPAYTVGLNGGNTVDSACKAIRDLDLLTGTKGSVAYIGTAQSTADLSMRCFEEQLPGYALEVITREESRTADADYLIGVTSSHSYYQAMQEYSAVFRGKYYTVLVRNDSERYQAFLKNGGALRTEGTELLWEFLSDAEETAAPIALEAGSYVYHLALSLDPKAAEVPDVTLRLVNKEEDEEIVLTEQNVSAEELQKGVSIDLPFALREKANALVPEIEADLKTRDSIRIVPQGISLTAEKYQCGQDEPRIEELFALINKLGTGVELAVIQPEKTIRAEEVGYEYLSAQLPKAAVQEISYSEAQDAVNDLLLLTTNGLTSDAIKLTGKYSCLAQAGDYMLWVRSDGALVQEAADHGFYVQNIGRKLPLQQTEASGVDSSAGTDIVKWPKAVYNVTVRLTAKEIEYDDTVEVALVRDKSDEEIEKEIGELMEEGYTKRQAMREVEPQQQCGSATYQAYDFAEDGTMIVSIRTSGKVRPEELSVDAYSWHGCEVEGEILWAEIA